jgi:hypothetical protein
MIMNKEPLQKRILKRPKSLKYATIQYKKELPLTINFNVKKPIGFVSLENTIDDYLVNPLGIYKECRYLYETLQPVIAGKILAQKDKQITKFEILAINLTMKP